VDPPHPRGAAVSSCPEAQRYGEIPLSTAEAAAEATAGVAEEARHTLDRALDIDFTRPLAFLALSLVYVGSRIPWLDMGYGTDPDAWRVALAADYLLSKGEYLPSRLPGYPLHEFVTVPLVREGWVWTNLSTVFISLVGVYLFARILNVLNLQGRGILTIAFAFAPLLWINSVMTIDYMWALTFIMGAYLALLYKQPTIGGIALGVAAGFRFTSLIMAVPFILLFLRSGQRPSVRPFLVATMLMTIAAYLPVLRVYGLAVANFYDAKVPVLNVLRLLGKDALGVFGAMAVLVGLVVSARRLARLPRDSLSDAHVLTWVSVIVLYFLTFSRLPHEVAYLLPVFPFGFFLMSRYFQRTVLVGVASVIVLAGFVDITSPGAEINRETFANANIGAGMLFSDLDTLRNQMDFAEELAEQEIPPHSVVLTGFIFPEFAVLNWERLEFGILDRDYDAVSMLSDRGEAVDKERDVRYVWLLEWENFRKLRNSGYSFYYVHDAAVSTAYLFDYRPAYFGAKTLMLLRGSPSTGAGAAETER
jgi:hypothetical protein